MLILLLPLSQGRRCFRPAFQHPWQERQCFQALPVRLVQAPWRLSADPLHFQQASQRLRQALRHHLRPELLRLRQKQTRVL